MSDNKDNPPINLELLERQLREALARRPSDAGQERTGTQSAEDPLAELSRLSGFENPSRSEQVVSAPVFRQALPNQSVHSDHFELQAVGDQYGVQPQFSQPKRPQEPVAESIPSGNSQSSQLFQSISVNYGGFQNQSMLTPQDMPVTPPAFLGFQSTNQPITQQNPHQAEPQPTEPQAYRGMALPPDPHELASPSHVSKPVTTPDFDSNPYEKIENSYAQPSHASVPKEPIFESRIFSTLRPAATDQQADPVPPAHNPSDLHQSDAVWTPQSEQRPLSMSESEAHDDLLHQAHEEPKTSSGGKGAYILLGLLALLGGGFGLAAYLRTEGAAVPSGPAPVITADKSPVKVPPADQGAAPNPSQSSAVYQPGKVEDPKEAKIVPNEEKPVDINTVPRPQGAPLLGEPKKIRTVTIRPDGSVVEENIANSVSSAPNVAATPRPGSTIAPAASPSVSVAPPIPSGAASTPAPQSQTPVAASQPQTPIVRVLPPERPQSIPALPQTTAPTPNPPPAAEKPAATAASSEKIETGSGDYGVQFGAPASEAEARTMIANLKKNNGKVFDGLSFVVQKADNSGRTIYRVRVIGLAREGAISLCEKMKSSGAACFVAKN